MCWTTWTAVLKFAHNFPDGGRISLQGSGGLITAAAAPTKTLTRIVVRLALTKIVVMDPTAGIEPALHHEHGPATDLSRPVGVDSCMVSCHKRWVTPKCQDLSDTASPGEIRLGNEDLLCDRTEGFRVSKETRK